MRHVWSLLAGMVITPLAWMLIAQGQATTISDPAGYPTDLSARLIYGGALLIAAGLLVGLVSSLRVSPVGALTAAIVYLGVSIYSWVDPLQAGLNLNRFDWSIAGADASLFSPIYTGVLPVLGGVLTICLFSPQRWRSWPTPPAPAPLVTGPEDTAEVYGQLLQNQPADEPTADLDFAPPQFAHRPPATTPASTTPTTGSGMDAPSWPKSTGSQ
jgi:hypothetical protein